MLYLLLLLLLLLLLIHVYNVALLICIYLLHLLPCKISIIIIINIIIIIVIIIIVLIIAKYTVIGCLLQRIKCYHVCLMCGHAISCLPIVFMMQMRGLFCILVLVIINIGHHHCCRWRAMCFVYFACFISGNVLQFITKLGLVVIGCPFGSTRGTA